MAIESLGYLIDQEEQHRLAAEATAFKDKILREMMESGESKKKYGLFIGALKAVKHYPGLRQNGIFLEHYYALMRYLDNISDGDAPPPQGFTPLEYIRAKISYAQSLKGLRYKNFPETQDDADKLMAYCFRFAQENLGENFEQETAYILESLEFDAARLKQSGELGDIKSFSDEVLQQKFFLLDTAGTTKAALKVFKEDPRKYRALEGISTAMRIYYNLRDFEEELFAGRNNISLEDMKKYDIKTADLSLNNYQKCPSIQNWFKDQASKGLELFKDYERNISKTKLEPITRLAIRLAFSQTAKKRLACAARGETITLSKSEKPST